MVKAVAGGGGRGIRPAGLVGRPERRGERPAHWPMCSGGAGRRRCNSFGDGGLYLERLLPGARHVEVQLLGDDAGAVIVLGERDCSVQAAPAEAAGDRAGARAERGDPGPAAGGRACASGGPPTGSGWPRRSSWSLRAQRRPGNRRGGVPRGQRPAAGGAHGHRGGPPGWTWWSCSCGWPAARRWPSWAWTRRTRRRPGHRGAGQGERRDARRGRFGAPGRRHADPVRAAHGRGVRVDTHAAAGTRSARATTRCWPR